MAITNIEIYENYAFDNQEHQYQDLKIQPNRVEDGSYNESGGNHGMKITKPFLIKALAVFTVIVVTAVTVTAVVIQDKLHKETGIQSEITLTPAQLTTITLEPVPSTQSNTPGCVTLPTGCYIFGQKAGLNWHKARDQCHEYNSRLVSIESQVEQNTLEYYIKTFQPGVAQRYWIDLTDEGHEGVWVWSDSGSPPFYRNWEPGQPDNYQAYQHCGTLKVSDFRWDDLACFGTSIHFICEVD